MSVVKGKRCLSSMEFYHNAIVLRKRTTELLMRDFGIKSFKRNFKYVAKCSEFSEEDMETFVGLSEKYGIGRDVEDEYPNWLIDKFRSYVMDILRDLMINITKANSIFATNIYECNVRRNYQNEAISDCFCLLEEFQYIISVVPVDAEKYMPYVELIDNEIALLKGWRKSDHKIYERIKEKELKENNNLGKI